MEALRLYRDICSAHHRNADIGCRQGRGVLYLIASIVPSADRAAAAPVGIIPASAVAVLKIPSIAVVAPSVSSLNHDGVQAHPMQPLDCCLGRRHDMQCLTQRSMRSGEVNVRGVAALSGLDQHAVPYAIETERWPSGISAGVPSYRHVTSKRTIIAWSSWTTL